MPKLRTGSAVCQCTVCDRYFKSDYAFQKHRIFANTKAQTAKDWSQRRCMTEAEMLAAGMAQNASELWVSEKLTTAGLASRTSDE